MSARIRGHYRIDSAGRIEPMTDVNSLAMKFHAPQVLPPSTQSRLIRLSIGGFVVLALGVGTMMALPQIQQLLTSGDSAQFASVRHLHGRHLHEMGDRILRRSWAPPEEH